MACANQKGGVGKTTTAVHLAVALRRAGRSVRLIDFDPQRNAVLSLCSDNEQVRDASGWRHWLGSHEVDLCTPVGGADTAPGLAEAGPATDVVVLDCPPELGGWTEAALRVAHHVLVPLQCEFLAMEGLAKILRAIEATATGLGKSRTVHILPVMLEPRSRMHQEILDDVWSHLPALTCRTWIPRDPHFPEASSYAMSLFRYNVSSLGARSYAKLAREVHDGWS